MLFCLTTFSLLIHYGCYLSYDQILHQIVVKSNNPQRSYCDQNTSNLGVVRHLGFDQK